MTQLFKNLFGVLTSAANDWGSIHPIVIHLPIVLLFLVPFFILSALIFQKSKKILYTIAVIFLLLGTASIFLATSTGDMAAEPLEATSRLMVETLDNHVTLAEKARFHFSCLAVLFLIYVVFESKLVQKFSKIINILFICVYLLIYSFSLILLFNAAHYGGELVHKHQIQSTLYSNQP